MNSGQQHVTCIAGKPIHSVSPSAPPSLSLFFCLEQQQPHATPQCWGWGQGGQLGLGDRLNRGDQPGQMGDALSFVDLGTGVTVSSVAVAFKHACAVIDNGFVKCWGESARPRCSNVLVAMGG